MPLFPPRMHIFRKWLSCLFPHQTHTQATDFEHVTQANVLTKHISKHYRKYIV